MNSKPTSAATRRTSRLLLVYASTVLLVAAAFASSRNNFWRWCEGRTNGDIPGLYFHLATVAIGGVALLIAIALALRLLPRRSSRRHRVMGAVLTIVLLTSASLVPRRPEMSAFFDGWTSWTQRQPLADAYRAALPLVVPPPPAVSLPDWWPSSGGNECSGFRLNTEEFGTYMSGSTPAEIYLLQPEPALVLSWWGSSGSWKRYIVLGSKAKPPACLDNGQVQSRAVDRDTVIGLQDQH